MKTKKCQDGTLTMGKGFIQFQSDDKPTMLLAFRCDDVTTFDYIDNYKMFIKEMGHYYQMKAAQSQVNNYKRLLGQKIQ